jgi:HTH-type transcriptional regulator / antitoxin HigA
MNWKVPKTMTQHKKAVKRTMEIFHAVPGTPEAKELELLLGLVKDYEHKHIILPELDPIDAHQIENGRATT